SRLTSRRVEVNKRESPFDERGVGRLPSGARLSKEFSSEGISVMHRRSILLATALLAAGAYAQPAPTPPVAPPIPQPGAAEPMTQAKPRGIASEPTGGKKEQDWDVNVRHGPGHDVPIDVTQGTWMNLDVSPDAREIAFDRLGDISTRRIPRGERRRGAPST